MAQRRTPQLALAIGTAAAIAAACASSLIGNPDAYTPVPMKRSDPFPSEADIANQTIEVVLEPQYAKRPAPARVRPAMKATLSSLEGFLAAAGAGVIDRSIHDLDRVRDELEAAEAGSGATGFTGADYALVVRMERFRRFSDYEPPSGLFKSDHDLASEKGVCTHHAEIELVVRAFQVPTNDVPRATWRLERSDSLELKQYSGCPFDRARENIWLERLVTEAVACLQGPIQNAFAPRGFVEERRTRPEAERSIYRTTLGRRNGARPELPFEVFRVSEETARGGEVLRNRRSIGSGRISEQLGQTYSWVLVEDDDLVEPVRAGDLVRVVYDDPTASVFGGRCGDVLTVQGEL